MPDRSTPPATETEAARVEAALRLLQQGQLIAAEPCARHGLALEENHADLLHVMGVICLAANHCDLAIAWFARAIRQNPDVADYFANLGMALKLKGDFDSAIKSYDRALVLKPDQAEISCRSTAVRPLSGLDGVALCPWYPTMRLFRQTVARDDAEVLDAVRAELQGRIAGDQP